MKWLHAARTRLRLLFARRAAESRMDREFAFHIEMETERLRRDKGLPVREARRQALAAFGGVEKHKEALRDGRGLAWLGGLSLDVKIGTRMLARYPGLTLVAVFAIAVAVTIGAISFEVIGGVLYSTLPVQEGDRVVALEYATLTPGSPERRLLRDFLSWREDLSSIEDLGAYRNREDNLRANGAAPQPIRVAEISASAFRLMRTSPLLGRYLIPDDDRPSAPPVVVIGHDVWQQRFGGSPDTVGRAVTLGDQAHVVVGVMPAGFAFPVNHQFWVPLREQATLDGPLQGPEHHVFGRLKPGVTLGAAQRELTLLGQRAAAGFPALYQRLRPTVLPYTREHFEIDGARAWMLWVVQLVVSGLLVVVAVNLAILVYARTVSRLGEVAVRSALGASRTRILAQLFMEALVLTGVGAAVGLLAADVVLDRMQSWIASAAVMPFWIDLRLSAGTVGYSAVLAVLAAAILGVVPGLKATGRPLPAYLRELGGGTVARLGRVWTALVIAQVGAAVAVLPGTLYIVSEVVRMQMTTPGFAAEEFLVATIRLKDSPQQELVRRLQSEPGVSAVTFSAFIPGYEPGRIVEFEPLAGPANLEETNSARIDPHLFQVYDARILAGRGLERSDVDAGAVVVNQAFARTFLGDGNPLGRRFRYTPEWKREGQGPWQEIVGVVSTYPSFPPSPFARDRPTVYHAASIDRLESGVLSVRHRGAVPDDFIERFRQMSAEVDPTLPVRGLTRLSDFYRENRAPWRYIASALALVTASVLLLAAAGMYALMSFTVAGRTREIGIRTALGAQPRRLLVNIFGRVTRQLALGWLAGSLLSTGLLSLAGLTIGRAAGLLVAVGAIVLVAGLLAAAGPARRGLRIQASDALKSE